MRDLGSAVERRHRARIDEGQPLGAIEIVVKGEYDGSDDVERPAHLLVQHVDEVGGFGVSTCSEPSGAN